MTIANPKIIDLINEKKEKPHISLEYFPPRTETGLKNLYARMDRMKIATDALFTDITWGAGGSTADLSLQIAIEAKKKGHVANMHLTCTNMSKDGDPVARVREALAKAYEGGIRNIVALRGDPPTGEDVWTQEEGGFACALDLVKFIRKSYGTAFGISVAGYPEGHPNAITALKEGEESSMTATEKGRCSTVDGITYVCKDDDYEKELAYLKEKVDAGADFIITQMFFDADVFFAFVKDCKARGIECPIVPGLMCINAYPGFKKMTKFCHTRVPKDLDVKMESLKDDEKAIKSYGIEFGVEICKKLSEGGTGVLHFYTLNLEKVVYGILDGLGYSNNLSSQSNEADASTMAAVGSAWARVGDMVKSIYGSGIVNEIRVNGAAVIEMNKWELAGGQKPIAILQPGAFTKAF